MTAVRTNFPFETVNLVPQDFVETEEPETAQEEFIRLGRGMAERRRQTGLPEEDPMTMEEIVAIIKEA